MTLTNVKDLLSSIKTGEDATLTTAQVQNELSERTNASIVEARDEKANQVAEIQECETEELDSIAAEQAALEEEKAQLEAKLADLQAKTTEAKTTYNELRAVAKSEHTTVANNIRAEEAKLKAFIEVGKTMGYAFAQSDNKEYVDYGFAIERQLEKLEANGYDLTDDETFATLFSPEICGNSQLNITSVADLEAQCQSVEKNNKDRLVASALDRVLPAYDALADITSEDDLYAATSDAINTFEDQIANIATAFERDAGETLQFFFPEKADKLNNGVASYEDYQGLKADLMETAKLADYDKISSIYAEIKGLDITADSFSSDLFSVIQEVEAEVERAANNYGLGEDAVYAASLSDYSIDNKSGFTAKTKAHLIDVNIQQISSDLFALQTNMHTVFNEETLEGAKATSTALDGRNGKRLSLAGVSQETVESINALKGAFVTALEQKITPDEVAEGTEPVNLKATEQALSAKAIQAISEMHGASLKKLCPAA